VILVQKFLAAYHRSGLRGSYRLTTALARRFRSLQSVPVQTESGPLYVDLRIGSSHGILRAPNAETGESLVMERIVEAGDTVFDVGAHLGFYTILLSRLVGEAGCVMAFEPNPELLPSLRRSLITRTNVTLSEAGLSDGSEQMELFIPEDATMASMADWTGDTAGEVHRLLCSFMTMDDLVEERCIDQPRFIKCDVEGAELKVFRGGRTVLDRVDAPVLLFEMNPRAAMAFGFGPEEHAEFLLSLPTAKYRLYSVHENAISDFSLGSPQYGNLLAVPASRRSVMDRFEVLERRSQ
jgi:FkbM family methyltransferase